MKALLSIKPEYVEKIISGEKEYEYRKRIFKQKIKSVIIYCTMPVGEIIGEKAQQMGMKEAEVIIKGVGAGRESALRAFAGKGIGVTKIIDRTPVPFNGPRAPKPRRV